MDLKPARIAIVNFGRRVKEYRKAAGLSQPELGRKSRVGPKFIGQIERAESNPSLATMTLDANALDAPLSELLQTDGASRYVRVPADAMARAKDALTVIGSPGSMRSSFTRSIGSLVTSMTTHSSSRT
jgi:transcriptional regulator with XRE-family HTH domain